MSVVPQIQPSTQPLIALVGETLTDPAELASTWLGTRQFSDPQQLLASEFACDAIVLTAPHASQALEWLTLLRSNHRLGLMPMLLARPFDAAVEELSDGICPDYDCAARLARQISTRATAAGELALGTSGDRLMAFLHLRPQRALTPILDWTDTRICHYPLADAYCDPGEDGFELIDRLRRRGLLENAELIERLHTCRNCGGGQLLFDEHCPQCGSIDIGEQNFLHCYACGHVEPQEAFLRNDGLLCPQCGARLRHIGVDYDRALETLACRSCRGRFTEPEVRVRCLQCRTVSLPQELPERRFHRVQLSAAGELAVRTGQLGDMFKLLDEFSQAHPEYFAQTLQWLLTVSRRYREVHFGVACLTFVNVNELAAQLPRHQLMQMFDALAQRLRALIRTTDLFMREDDQHCWLLLPQTDPEGIDVLRERLVALGDSLTTERQRIRIVIRVMNSTDIDPSVTDAHMLMGMLRDSSG